MMDGLEEFASVLAKIQDQRLTEELLVCMLTKRELEEIDGRWKLVKLLDLDGK